MTHMQCLEARPADAILGLMSAYRADSRHEKIDLAPGIFKTEDGLTPVMGAVKKAEAVLLEHQDSKVYEGPRGNEQFCAEIEKFVFGKPRSGHARSDTLSFVTPGGCGALFLGVGLMKRMGTKRVWVSNPTWPNHIRIVEALGLQSVGYQYSGKDNLLVDRLLESLDEAVPGDGIIIQGPCHNPTGIDLEPKQWETLARACQERRLIPLLDVAYHGFGRGLNADIAGVQKFIELSPEVLISYSCSKNFSLYRERTGCFLAKGPDRHSIDAASTHVAELARSSYSMPPAHGAAIVATILCDARLKLDWEQELTSMRERITKLRNAFARSLVAHSGKDDFSAFSRQNGMFSQLPISAEAAAELKDKSGVYIPASGRVNIAGFSGPEIDRVARLLAAYL